MRVTERFGRSSGGPRSVASPIGRCKRRRLDEIGGDAMLDQFRDRRVVADNDALDGVPLNRVGAFRAGLGPWLAEHCPEAGAIDDQTKALSDDFRTRLKTELSALARSVVGSNIAPKEDPP